MSKPFDAAGLHFTYPKDKKAAMRAAEVLAESHLQRSSSDSSDRASLKEHPADVVSHISKLLATAGLQLAERQATIFCTCILEAFASLKDNADRQMMMPQKLGAPN